MIASLLALNSRQALASSALPHCSNLLYQLNKKQIDKLLFFEKCYKCYFDIREAPFDDGDIKCYVERITNATNAYLDIFWPPENNPFSHQADFTSSVIPEMLCVIFSRVIARSGVALEVSAQKDLAIECIFTISSGGSVRFKNKRVDVSVAMQCEMIFNGMSAELPIPLLAIECKTNLDKNMISGIEHSASELKKSFPDCRYFVVSELSDFDVRKTNYASSGIDEIYILRNQKRAIVRRNPLLRNQINAELVFEIVKLLSESIESMNTGALNLEAKMQKGKLIGRVL